MSSLSRKGGRRGLPLILSVMLGLLLSPCEMGSEQQRPSMVGVRAARVSRRDDTLGADMRACSMLASRGLDDWCSGWGQVRPSWGMGHRGTGLKNKQEGLYEKGSLSQFLAEGLKLILQKVWLASEGRTVLVCNTGGALGVLPTQDHPMSIGVGELWEENCSGSSGLGAAGLANEEQQWDKARIVPLGAGLAALHKKVVERIIAYDYIDLNELPLPRGK